MAIPNKCHTIDPPWIILENRKKSNFDLCGYLCGVHMVHDLCVIVDSFQHGQVPSGRRAGALGLRRVKQAMLISCSQPNTETHQPHIWMSTTRLLWPFENFRLYLLNRERETQVLPLLWVVSVSIRRNRQGQPLCSVLVPFGYFHFWRQSTASFPFWLEVWKRREKKEKLDCTLIEQARCMYCTSHVYVIVTGGPPAKMCVDLHVMM